MDQTQVQKYLGGASYPASKEDLIAQAQTNNAPQEVLDMLDGLSERQYDSPTDVTEEIA